MRALFAASLLAFSAVSAAHASPTTLQVETLVALARVQGVVRYFHPSDSLDAVKWDAFLVHAAGRVRSPRDLEALYAPIVAGFRVVAAGTPIAPPQGEGPRVEWRHLGYGMEADPGSPYVSWRTHHDPLHGGKVKGPFFQHRDLAAPPVHTEPVLRVALGEGLEAHVPVSLPLSAAKVGEAQKARLEALAKELDAVKMAGETVTRAQAHADGIAAWNVARHFYPYWPVVKVDWEGVLREWLARQPETQSRAELRDALRRLTSPLDDGQLTIADNRAGARGFVPISVRPVGTQWVIDASQAPDKARPGDVIAEIDGVPAAKWFGDRMALVSGSPQHRRWRLAYELMSGARDAAVKLRLARGNEMLEATIAYSAERPMQGPRPAPIHEVRPGVHYVDVTRVDQATFAKSLEALKQASAVVFDLRGYPMRDAVGFVPYWLPASDPAQWMFVPRFDRPFAESSAAWSIGWQAAANGALARPAKVLIADARALGYAESLAAYFPDLRVGPIVGEPTAGANGNVARAILPSGMSFFFTGMRVTRHDAKTPVHLQGIAPDVAARPTIEGIRAGRDEVLERAIAVAEERKSRGQFQN